MGLRQFLTTRLRRFSGDESGNMSVELLLMSPILAWVMLSTATYFDAFRSESVNFKASVTVADAISREAEITPAYLNGIYSLLQFLTRNDSTPDLRITALTYDAASDKYIGIWSKAKGGFVPYANLNSDIDLLRARLPIMANGARMLLIETASDFQPMWQSNLFGYSSGLSASRFSTFTVINPRFTPRTCWNDTPSNPSAAVC